MTMYNNFLLMTDSYKLTHWQMYPPGTTGVFSYFESRKGAKYPATTFFGLQAILGDYLVGPVFDQVDIEEAAEIVAAHLGDPSMFNREGWEYILKEHGGMLPLRISAVPEGSVIPAGNVLMTVENTDPKCAWLTNYVESLLTHVWYPSTVATQSKHVRNRLEGWLGKTGDPSVVDFMLHDFGYRGATGNEAAALGGAGHLINFRGTDTLVAMEAARDYYDADLSSLAFSVPATEHSVMTAKGRAGEFEVLDQLLATYPTGILSVVADSFDIYAFTNVVATDYREDILARDGRFVIRPDSITPTHRSPGELVLWMIQTLWNGFGGTTNAKGYKVLDDHIRILWGDGIDPEGIDHILRTLEAAGFAAENMVFGMGGGLLQKVNRDTQRFAFKSSAQQRDGAWYEVKKQPLDTTKESKAGRLKLVLNHDGYETVQEDAPGENLLVPVFENGVMVKTYTFDEVRANSGGLV